MVMRAETLEPGTAFISPRPTAQLATDVINLFPQESRRAIATARLQLDDRRRHFDDARVEINRTARRKLERATRSRNHFPADQPLRCSENLFGPLPDIIDDEAELGLQPDDRARRRQMKARPSLGAILFYDSLHSRGTRVR